MPTTCKDKNRVDCKMLDTYLGICRDNVTSMAYCQKYCGLCGQTTEEISTTNPTSSEAFTYVMTSSKPTAVVVSSPSTCTTQATFTSSSLISAMLPGPSPTTPVTAQISQSLDHTTQSLTSMSTGIFKTTSTG